jgi:hypothetical protein
MKEVAIAIWAGFFSFYTICIYGSEVLNFEWVMIVLRLNLKVFTIWCTIWHCIYLSLFQDMFFIQKSGSKFAVKQTLITLIKTYIYLQNTKLNGNSERNIYNIYTVVLAFDYVSLVIIRTICMILILGLGYITIHIYIGYYTEEIIYYFILRPQNTS